MGFKTACVVIFTLVFRNMFPTKMFWNHVWRLWCTSSKTCRKKNSGTFGTGSLGRGLCLMSQPAIFWRFHCIGIQAVLDCDWALAHGNRSAAVFVVRGRPFPDMFSPWNQLCCRVLEVRERPSQVGKSQRSHLWCRRGGERMRSFCVILNLTVMVVKEIQNFQQNFQKQFFRLIRTIFKRCIFQPFSHHFQVFKIL